MVDVPLAVKEMPEFGGFVIQPRVGDFVIFRASPGVFRAINVRTGDIVNPELRAGAREVFPILGPDLSPEVLEEIRRNTGEIRDVTSELGIERVSGVGGSSGRIQSFRPARARGTSGGEQQGEPEPLPVKRVVPGVDFKESAGARALRQGITPSGSAGSRAIQEFATGRVQRGGGLASVTARQVVTAGAEQEARRQGIQLRQPTRDEPLTEEEIEQRRELALTSVGLAQFGREPQAVRPVLAGIKGQEQLVTVGGEPTPVQRVQVGEGLQMLPSSPIEQQLRQSRQRLEVGFAGVQPAQRELTPEELAIAQRPIPQLQRKTVAQIIDEAAAKFQVVLGTLSQVLPSRTQLQQPRGVAQRVAEFVTSIPSATAQEIPTPTPGTIVGRTVKETEKEIPSLITQVNILESEKKKFQTTREQLEAFGVPPASAILRAEKKVIEERTLFERREAEIGKGFLELLPKLPGKELSLKERISPLSLKPPGARTQEERERLLKQGEELEAGVVSTGLGLVVASKALRRKEGGIVSNLLTGAGAKILEITGLALARPRETAIVAIAAVAGARFLPTATKATVAGVGVLSAKSTFERAQLEKQAISKTIGEVGAELGLSILPGVQEVRKRSLPLVARAKIKLGLLKEVTPEQVFAPEVLAGKEKFPLVPRGKTAKEIIAKSVQEFEQSRQAVKVGTKEKQFIRTLTASPIPLTGKTVTAQPERLASIALKSLPSSLKKLLGIKPPTPDIGLFSVPKQRGASLFFTQLKKATLEESKKFSFRLFPSLKKPTVTEILSEVPSPLEPAPFQIPTPILRAPAERKALFLLEEAPKGRPLVTSKLVREVSKGFREVEQESIIVPGTKIKRIPSKKITFFQGTPVRLERVVTTFEPRRFEEKPLKTFVNQLSTGQVRSALLTPIIRRGLARITSAKQAEVIGAGVVGEKRIGGRTITVAQLARAKTGGGRKPLLEKPLSIAETKRIPKTVSTLTKERRAAIQELARPFRKEITLVGIAGTIRALQRRTPAPSEKVFRIPEPRRTTTKILEPPRLPPRTPPSPPRIPLIPREPGRPPTETLPPFVPSTGIPEEPKRPPPGFGIPPPFFTRTPLVPPAFGRTELLKRALMRKPGARSFAPSVQSLLLNIRGKQPKGILSGFEVRPLPLRVEGKQSVVTRLALGKGVKPGIVGKQLASGARAFVRKFGRVTGIKSGRVKKQKVSGKRSLFGFSIPGRRRRR